MSLQKVYYLSLPLKNRDMSPVAVVVENDVGGNKFIITLTQDGKPFPITEASRVTFTCVKADGTAVVDEVESTESGKISYVLHQQCLACPGIVKATIEVYSDTTRVTSTQFLFEVKAQLNDGTAIPSAEEYPVLQQLIIDNQAVQTVEAARVTAEADRVAREETRRTLESERCNAEQDRQSEELKRSNAEETRDLNEQQREVNETFRENNESRRKSAETARETAEQTRSDYEIARQTAEQTRENRKYELNTEESRRTIAEENRVTDEEARVTAEQGRVTAEEARVTAENKRGTDFDNAIVELRADFDDVVGSLKVIGEYDPLIQYYPKNIVRYNGSAYMSTGTIKGISPAESSVWGLLVSKGDKGAPLNPRGNYANDVSYVVGDLVNYDGSVYSCIQDCLAILPTDTAYWELFLGGGTTGTSEQAQGFFADFRFYHKCNTGHTELFQDSAEWTADSDFTNVRLGSQSLKVANDSELAKTLVASKMTDVDLTKFNGELESTINDFIVLAFYTSDITALPENAAMRVSFEQSTGNRMTKVINKADFTLSDFDGWHIVEMQKSSFTAEGTGSWEGITKISLEWECIAGKTGAYVSFQLLQLIRKHPELTESCLFQRQINGVWVAELQTGDYCSWAIADIYGDVVCKRIIDRQSSNPRKLTGTIPYKDFTAMATVKAVQNGNCDGIGWEVDQFNYIYCFVGMGSYVSIYYKSTQGEGYVEQLPLQSGIVAGDEVKWVMRKKGSTITVEIYRNKALSPETILTIETSHTEGYFIASIPAYGYGEPPFSELLSASITATGFAARAGFADEAETVKDSNIMRKDVAQTMTANLTANGGTDYSTSKVRNIIAIEEGTTEPPVENGALLIIYEAVSG
ncbi:MAG: BppU family phage baseplate upper protein [Eubacteriales bacterium]|nr:BppU family phage baseplate upper protein [Eubacteriales bacterium]